MRNHNLIIAVALVLALCVSGALAKGGPTEDRPLNDQAPYIQGKTGSGPTEDRPLNDQAPYAQGKIGSEPVELDPSINDSDPRVKGPDWKRPLRFYKSIWELFRIAD